MILCHPPGELVHVRRLFVPVLIPTAFLPGTFVNTGFTQQATYAARDLVRGELWY